MAETFRTSVSAVFWTASTDDAEALAEKVRDIIPDPDRDATLVAIEYRPEGRPPEPEPIQTMPAPENGEVT